MIKPKRSMTSFDVASVVRELEGYAGSRLVNIYSLTGGGFLFRLKGRGGDARLVAVPGERVHLTAYDVSEKGFPPPLVMALRKHLRGGRLEAVAQLGFDRILVLEFVAGGERYRVYVEVLPRGFLVLADSGGRVLQSTGYRELRDRVIRRGHPYQPPPGGPRKPDVLEPRFLEELLAAGGEKEAARVLARGLGYPGEAVEEALLRAGLRPEAPAGEAAAVAEELVEALRGLYHEALEPGGWLLYDQEGLPVTVVSFEPKGLAEHYGLRKRFFQRASEAFDEYFVRELRRLEEARAASAVEAERKRLLASIEKARRSLEELRERIVQLERRMSLVGENIGLVYEALECARRLRERAGWEHVPGNCPGVVDVVPSEGKVVVSLGGELVPLDIRVSPDRLLVEMAKRKGEIEAKIRRGEEALRELEARLGRLEEEARRLAARARASVRRKLWYERYHWLVTSNGFLAVGGRDASQNESVVKRYLTPKRIFMHADIHGAPAVVLFAEGVEPPERDLRDAALLAAAYSRAWKSGIGAVDVYWVWGSQVSKSAPAGEYLSRGAFMVYGKRNYVRNVELRLGIGVGEEGGSPVVIVGPPDLVKRRSLVYAVLVPGDEDPSKLAQRLRRLLRSKAGEDKQAVIEALRPEEIRLRIPGRSRVIHVGRGEAREPPRPIKQLPGEEEAEASASG